MSGIELGRLSLLMLLAAWGIACRATLRDQMDAQEAEHQSAVLQNLGIDARPSSASGRHDAWRIDVPRRDLPRAFRLLSRLGLTSKSSEGEKPLLDGKGFLPVPGEDQIRKRAAVTAQLTRTLKGVPTVLEARVHLGFGQGASVLIRHLGHAPPMQEKQVRLLVAGAAGDLEPDDVNVIFMAVTNLAPESPAPRRDLSPLTTLGVVSSILLNMLMGAGLIVIGIRHRRIKTRQKKSA